MNRGSSIDITLRYTLCEFCSENDQRSKLIVFKHLGPISFVVDGAESELGILDLIQVFVESLDRTFENVCELDLIFHFDEVHLVLAEIIQGGLVLETNLTEIASCGGSGSRGLCMS